MYGKVLIPLDGSDQAEVVFSLIREDLSTESQVILLKVIPRSKTQVVMGFILPRRVEETEKSDQALSYLRSAVRILGGDPDRWDQWRCIVELSDNLSQSILECASRESVDLIAMNDRYGGGIARFMKGGVASEVQRRALMEVKVFNLL